MARLHQLANGPHRRTGDVAEPALLGDGFVVHWHAHDEVLIPGRIERLARGRTHDDRLGSSRGTRHLAEKTPAAAG